MTYPNLKELGWNAEFLRQLDIDEIGRLTPVRLTSVHRDRVEALGEDGPRTLLLPPGLTTGEVAVGDWVLADTASDPEADRIDRVLDRKSLLHRRAAGTDVRDQLIAANVDTLFITSSFNEDFNPARLERFLALALAAGVQPVFVMTKADLCDHLDPYLDALRDLAPSVPVVALDARDGDAAAQLADWCGPGQTVALLGSSGVGKSTLAATLTGDDIVTQDIRDDDAKGRHTTTARSFHRLTDGGWLIDTPGMRAVRLAGVEEGIDAVFADVAELAAGCRFTDCQHDTEPGCAVQAAIEAGDLDPDRLARWQKLKLEEARHSESLAQANARGKRFGKIVKEIKRAKPRYRE